jgi:phage shock protein A
MAGMSEPHEPPAIIDAEIVENSTPAPVVPQTDYTDAGVPNFDYVRDRIESRVATSIGTAELNEPSTKSIDDQLADRERAGRDKLEEIRRSLRGDG